MAGFHKQCNVMQHGFDKQRNVNWLPLTRNATQHTNFNICIASNSCVALFVETGPKKYS